MSRLSIAEADRIIAPGEAKTARRFLDFCVDGEPLYSVVCAAGIDNVTALWLGVGPWTASALDAVRRMLGEADADAPGGRVSVYVCAECGDLGCGAVTVLVERQSDSVTWRAWGHQNNYENGVHPVDGLPEMNFDRSQYEAVLRDALVRLDSAQHRDP